MKDGIDTSTTMGRFLFHIFGAIDEMEREVINERVISDVAAAKARGREGSRKIAHTPKQIEGMTKIPASGETIFFYYIKIIYLGDKIHSY
nr:MULTISPECIES: recombinase family protein [Bacillus]